MSATTPSSDETDKDDRVTKRQVAFLLARCRQNLYPNDSHISEDKYTDTDANGDKIHRIKRKNDKIELNLSKLLGSAPSTTSNMESSTSRHNRPPKPATTSSRT